MKYHHFDMLPERAFQRDPSGKIKPQGGGGGTKAPSSQTVTQTTIPEYARPYAESMLGQAQALTDINQNPYQPYTGQRFASFSPMQAQAFQNISGQQVAPQITDASNIAYTAAGQGLAAQPGAQALQQTALGYGGAGAGYGGAASTLGIAGAEQAALASQEAQRRASMFGGMGAGYGAAAAGLTPQALQYGAGAAGYGAQGAGIGGLGVQAAGQGFGAGAQYAQMATSPEAQQAYMSPYMQNVVEQQQKEAIRQANIARGSEQARAVQQGAFGGSRSAIVESEMQRGLQDRLAMIQAQGSQNAFQQAQQAQQFGAGLGIQGLQAGYQGLQTGLAGTAQGIQGQQAGLQGLGQAGQLYGLGITGAQTGLQGVGQQIAGGQLGLAGAQTGIQGQQAGIQGAQAGLQGVGQAVGAGQYGLQGAQTALQGAGQLGQLGQTQFGQEMSITDALQKYGALQQQQQQQGMDFAYQQYLAQQQYPYQQLSYMSDLMRGIPSSQSSMYQYQQQPALAPQLLGAGLSAYGAFARKAGGRIPEPKRYAAGGQVTPDAMGTMDVQQLPSKLRRLSDSQLAAYARSVKDAISLSAINSELTRRTRARSPMGQPQDTTVAEGITKRAEAASIGQPMVTMAGGGIVALQSAGRVGDSLTEEQKAALGMAGIPEWLAAPGQAIRNWWQEQRAQSPKGIKEAGEAEAARVMDAAPQAETIGPQGTQALPVPSPTPITPTDITTQQTSPQAPPAPGAGGRPVGSSGIAARQAQRQGQQPQGTMVPTDRVLSYEEYQAMIPKEAPNPEDMAIMDDMKKRLNSRMQRAEKQQDTAKYDAIMMAGLAMMSGTSLADGIAKAAQTGGATFMMGKKEADKAITLAEDAQSEFNKYQIALRKDDKKQARESFDKYVGYALKLDAANKDYAVGMARANAAGGAGADPNVLFNRTQTALNQDQTYKDLVTSRKKLAEDAQKFGQTEQSKSSNMYKNVQTQLNAVNQQIANYEKNYFQNAGVLDVYNARKGVSTTAAPATGNVLKFDAQGNLIQ